MVVALMLIVAVFISIAIIMCICSYLCTEETRNMAIPDCHICCGCGGCGLPWIEISSTQFESNK